MIKLKLGCVVGSIYMIEIHENMKTGRVDFVFQNIDTNIIFRYLNCADLSEEELKNLFQQWKQEILKAK